MVKCNGVFPTGSIAKGKEFRIICGRCGSECYAPQPTSDSKIYHAKCSHCGTKNDVEKSLLVKAHQANRKNLLGGLGLGRRG